MFRTESAKKQVNKLRKRVGELSLTIDGGIFDNGIVQKVASLESSIKNLQTRMSVLEEIVRESGLVTDFDNDEIKIREDRKLSAFGGVYSTQVPYQINKVKTVG